MTPGLDIHSCHPWVHEIWQSKIWLSIPYNNQLPNRITTREKTRDCKLVTLLNEFFLQMQSLMKYITSISPPLPLSRLLSISLPCYFLTPAPQKVPLSNSSLSAPVCQKTDTKHRHTPTKFTEHRTCTARNRDWKKQRSDRVKKGQQKVLLIEKPQTESSGL